MASRGGGRGLLDERLAWPWAPPPGDPPWRLGHGLAAVGPGWWPLVRRAFAAVAETPGASVRSVRQKCCLLDLWLAVPPRVPPALADAGLGAPAGARLARLAAALREVSRTRCEVCGRATRPVLPGGAPGRNHCVPCAALHDTLAHEDPRWAELRLWEHHAGGVRWPRVRGDG